MRWIVTVQFMLSALALVFGTAGCASLALNEKETAASHDGETTPEHSRAPLVCESRARWRGGVRSRACSATEPQGQPQPRVDTVEPPNHTLVVLVVSARPHFSQRELIRQTWASKEVLSAETNLRMPNASSPPRSLRETQAYPSAKVLFVVGRPATTLDNNENSARLAEEHEVYGDIVQVPVVDVYANLIYKVLCAIDATVEEHWPAAFIMKVDDDTYVDLPMLLHDLVNPRHPRRLHLQGQIWTGSPIRNRNHKNWVSKAYYPIDTYLPYPHGAHYIISSDFATFIHENERFLAPSIIPASHRGNLEDVKMGVWAFSIGVNMVHDVRFVESVNCHSSAVSLSDVPAKAFRGIYRALRNGSNSGLCTNELHAHAVGFFLRRTEKDGYLQYGTGEDGEVSQKTVDAKKAMAHNNAGVHLAMLGKLDEALTQFLLARDLDHGREWPNLDYFTKHGLGTKGQSSPSATDSNCPYHSMCAQKLRQAIDRGLRMFAAALSEP